MTMTKRDRLDELERYLTKAQIDSELPTLVCMTNAQLACVERLLNYATRAEPVAPERNLKRAFR